MFEKYLEALKAKFPEISESYLRRIAEKKSKTITKEEDIPTSVEGVTFQNVLDSYGDSRATEAQQTSVANYEKKHGLKDGKPVHAGGDKTEPEKEKSTKEESGKGGDEMPAWFKAYKEDNDKRWDKLNAGTVTKNRKQILEEKLKDIPEKLRAKELKNFERMQFENDEAFDAYVEETVTDYADVKTEEVQDELGKSGATIIGGTSSKGLSKAKLDNVVANIT